MTNTCLYGYHLMIKRSTSEISAVFIISDKLGDYHRESLAGETAYDSFDSHHTQIVNNHQGGAGYFAETHHTASFNVNQIDQSHAELAIQLDSRAFGSVDIQTSTGEFYNPKYYATADQSYQAGAEIIHGADGLVAKYAGQHIVVPSDQLEQVLQHHHHALALAQSQGNMDYYNALSNIDFTDRVVGADGVSSTPLTYHEAQQGTLAMQNGTMPEYAHHYTLVDDISAVAEGSAMAMGMVTAVELAPALLNVMGKLANNQVSLVEAGNALIANLKEKKSAEKIAQTGKKVTVAGGLTFATGLNAGLATFLVTYAWDIQSLYRLHQAGQISHFEMLQRIKLAGLDRGVMSLLTYGAVATAGPLGLLVPVVIQWLAIDKEDAKRFEHGLNDVFHGWMRTINATSQYKAEQWQLNYAMATGQRQQMLNSQGNQQKNNEQTQHDITLFNRTIEHDDFITVIETKHNVTPTQIEQNVVKNLAVLAKVTDTTDIDQAIGRFMIENHNNQRLIESAVLDSMVLLDPQANNTAEQLPIATNLLQRLGNNLFSSSTSVQAGQIDKLMTAQIAAMRMLQSLQHDQSMSLEFITLLQKRIGNFEASLNQIHTQHDQDLSQLYQSMAQMYVKLRNRLIENEQRIQNLERNLALQEWLNHTNARKYHGQTLMQLDESLRLATVINEFIHLTEGKWTQKDLLTLDEMLYRVHLNTPEAQGYFENIFNNKKLSNNLFDKLKLIDRKTIADEADTTWITQVYQQQPTTLPAIFNQQVSLKNGIWDNVLTLLWCIKAAEIRPYRLQAMERQKQNWLTAIDKITDLINEGILSKSLTKQVELLKQEITAFKLVVPIIGKYSVGKSTLLNTWLETSIQNTDLGACTSVPTEFHYTSQVSDEKLVLAYLDDEGILAKETTLIANYPLINQGKLPIPNRLQHLELHLHLPALALHPDLVLVDTPGLESNVGSHEQALMQYSGSVNSSFILCASRNHLGEEEKQFVNRQYMFGKPVSLLVCQEDLINIQDRPAVRATIATQAQIDANYGLVRGCSAHTGDIKGFSDILNFIEEQKSEIFAERFSQSIEELLNLAKQDLQHQINNDHSHEQLLAQRKAIEIATEELERSYDKQRRNLIGSAKGRLCITVSNTVKQALMARQSQYLSMMMKNAENCQQAMQADMQNAIELSVEQIVFPEIREAAQAMQSAVVLEHKSLNSGVLVAYDGDQTDDSSFMLWGGVAGGLAGVTMGVAMTTMPFIMIPGAILGGFIGNSIKQSKAEQALSEATNGLMSHLDTLLPKYISDLAESALNDIYASLKSRIEAEKDKIIAIDNQLELDKSQKEALIEKLNQHCQAIEAIIKQTSDNQVSLL